MRLLRVASWPLTRIVNGLLLRSVLRTGPGTDMFLIRTTLSLRNVLLSADPVEEPVDTMGMASTHNSDAYKPRTEAPAMAQRIAV